MRLLSHGKKIRGANLMVNKTVMSYSKDKDNKLSIVCIYSDTFKCNVVYAIAKI